MSASPSSPASISAADLQNTAFQEPRWVVPGLIPEGVTLFAGKPKVGKSWMALALAIAVATGGEVLGVKCPQAAVVYAALEDGRNRLRSRMDTLLGEEPWPHKLRFVFELPPLDHGGLDELRALCTARECRLVIVDVLARVRSTKKHGESLYDYDYRSLMPLANLARELGIAIVVVHHERKLAAIDRLDCVSGTTGLTAAADAIVTLSRDNSRFMLAGRGRDLEEFEWPLGFEDGRWQLQSDVHKLNPDQQRVLDVLREAQRPMGPKEVAALLGLKEPTVRQTLRRLFNRGLIENPSYGLYTCHTGTLENKPANPIG
jgi:hypothetical protein